jgi:2,5-diketo-D-gluconate reductase B
MVQTITFGNSQVPSLGFGTFQLLPDETQHCVEIALDVGYRHIDTAQGYENEEQVGLAIAASPVDRDDVFLTTKVRRNNASRQDVHTSTQESVKRLGVDHVDLLLLHWPAEDIAPLEETMEALSEVREAGLTRHIGVSNMPSAMLQRALDLAPIVTNQVEHHPYLHVDAIRRVLDIHGGFLTAYSPIARGIVLDDPLIQRIAINHDATPAQVTLRWLLQKGTVAIPKSAKPERIRANFEVFGFELTGEEMKAIDGLNRGERLISPPFAPQWDAA